jgi:hypothetical protein
MRVGEEARMGTLARVRQAFVAAFWEGFSLYFSPFTGFWQALRKLRIASMMHDVLKTEKGVASR